jgi:hypothetical protein
MFSFESFVFTMLLVSSTEAGSTSLRSSVSDWSRRLSFPAIAGYVPQTLVTDHVSHNWCWVLVGLLAKLFLRRFCSPFCILHLSRLPFLAT